VLGYGFDPDSPVLNEAIAHGRQMRLMKLESRLAYLKDNFGITFTDLDIEWLRSLNSVARPHLGRLLISHGYARSMEEAMDKYLKNGGGFPDDRIDAGEAISAIRAAGGIAVYAHPIGGEREKRLSREEVIPRIDRLVSLGISGIECYYSRYSEEDQAMLEEIARERGLLLSGGSDYHGENKTVRLGTERADGALIDVERITVIPAILGG
jgi:predicted metal-dependent phosphoesterase TrpH